MTVYMYVGQALNVYHDTFKTKQLFFTAFYRLCSHRDYGNAALLVQRSVVILLCSFLISNTFVSLTLPPHY
jgi:hypothetical protein